jgi:allantoate deiminase
MIQAQRLEERIQTLGKIGKTKDGGVTRLALTQEDKEGQELVKSWMEQAGMQVRLDAAGNLIGRKEGTIGNAEPVVIGSHIDTVINGGMFDGALGVIAGIEVVQHISEEHIRIERPIEVIAFCEEEGSRFQVGGLFGSQAMVGKIQPSDLDIRDKSGISRREALMQFGLNPDDLFTKVARRKGEMAVYLEMHIEQGPVLEEMGIPFGIVNGITGAASVQITVEGKANHAGTTPMKMRNDAFLGAAEISLALEKICLFYGPPAVGTIGTADVFPGLTNIVPGRVMLRADIRDLSAKRRDEILEQFKMRASAIGKERGLNIELNIIRKVNPVLSSSAVVDIMKQECGKVDVKFLEMPSGAGHDAQMMAELTEMGMIFVRSTNGSHNPKEFAAIEDITAGAELLSRTALHYLVN